VAAPPRPPKIPEKMSRNLPCLHSSPAPSSFEQIGEIEPSESKFAPDRRLRVAVGNPPNPRRRLGRHAHKPQPPLVNIVRVEAELVVNLRFLGC